MQDTEFMKIAVDQAKIAFEKGEVPVGAVVTRNGELVSMAYNTRESDKNALAHAELSAIDAACKKLGGWRLFECDLYVTLEPCPMCAGAIINSRIKRVIYGCPDIRFGAMGSLFDLTEYPLNHKPEIIKGVLEEECRALMQDFFKRLRNKGSSK